MRIKASSLVSVLAAAGIAAIGASSNSVSAHSQWAAVPAPPANNASLTVATPVVTYNNVAANTGYNMGTAGLIFNINVGPNTTQTGTPGYDTLVAMAAAGPTPSGNMPIATWTCRTSLFQFPFVTKQTNLATGYRANPPSGAGVTAYAQGASGPNMSYPRVAANLMLADCN